MAKRDVLCILYTQQNKTKKTKKNKKKNQGKTIKRLNQDNRTAPEKARSQHQTWYLDLSQLLGLEPTDPRTEGSPGKTRSFTASARVNDSPRSSLERPPHILR